MGRKCEKGKTCGATCISRMKVCLLDLNNNVSSAIGKLKAMLGGGSSGEKRPKEPVRELTPKITQKEMKIKEENSRRVEDTFKGGRGRKFFKGLYGELLERFKDEKSQEEVKEIAASHYRQSQEFMRRLASNIPPGVKMTVTDSDKVKLDGKTKSGDRVIVTFAPRSGFHFSVNDSYSVGTVKTRDGQIQVAMLVRSLFRSTIGALPEGATLVTMAFAADGKGKEREEIYRKMGFSRPQDDMMYGKVGPNRKSLIPADWSDWVSQASTRNAVFFSESPPITDGLGSVEDWYRIVFGKPVTKGLRY